MLDIGSWEFLLIVVIGLLVIGPRDLPGAIRTISGWVRRARELAREFQGGLEDIARDTEMDKVKREFESEFENAVGPGGFENAVDPDGELKQSLDLEDVWRDGGDAPSIEDAGRATGKAAAGPAAEAGAARSEIEDAGDGAARGASA